MALAIDRALQPDSGWRNYLRGVPNNSVLYLPRLEGGGPTAIDYSGQGNDGTITGATWIRLPSGLWYLDFDGTDDKVVCGTDSSMNPANNLTVKVWVNPTNFTDDDRAIFNRDNTTDGRSFTSKLGLNTGFLYLAISKSAAGDFSELTDNTDAFTAGAWQHVGCTYKFVTDGTSEMRLYRNGSEIKSKLNCVGPISTTAATNNQIGLAQNNTQDFLGGMTLLVMTNITWTATQFAENYAAERRLFGV